MVHDDGREQGRELRRVAARFERWRRERASRRERIPQELWQVAVEASSRTGISRTARVLRLNEQELRRRARDGEVESAVPSVRQRTAAFVELRPAAGSAPSWVMELETVAGARLRIEGRGAGEVDLASLAAALLCVSS